MILTGKKICEEHHEGKIRISPFDEGRLTTNSYDLSLGGSFLQYNGEVLDCASANPYSTFEADGGSVSMRPGDFLLAHSLEVVGSDFYVPIIHARSGIARLGLFVHVTADLIDIGSHGNVTFQLFSTMPITIYPGMRIAQVTFWKPLGEISLYNGKYQSSRGPVPSLSYKDSAHFSRKDL